MVEYGRYIPKDHEGVTGARDMVRRTSSAGRGGLWWWVRRVVAVRRWSGWWRVDRLIRFGGGQRTTEVEEVAKLRGTPFVRKRLGESRSSIVVGGTAVEVYELPVSSAVCEGWSINAFKPYSSKRDTNMGSDGHLNEGNGGARKTFGMEWGGRASLRVKGRHCSVPL